MDKLINALPMSILIAVFVLLWGWFGFFAAIGGTLAIAVLAMAAFMVFGPK